MMDQWLRHRTWGAGHFEVFAAGSHLAECFGRECRVERETVREMSQGGGMTDVERFGELPETYRGGTLVFDQLPGLVQEGPPQITVMVRLAPRS